MTLCLACLKLGCCRRKSVRLVSHRELASPSFISDVRTFAHSLRLSRDAWQNQLVDWYRDYPGRIVDMSGNEVDLDISVFEVSSIRDWFRDTCCRQPTINGGRYVRAEARQRFIVMATILRATFPTESLMWGMRAANDN
jgi:hypothetical protein